jgi:hypothetical protein
MRKTLTVFMFAALVTGQAFAVYVVVLKDGTRYIAKSKWTVQNGKALVVLEKGGSLALDPALIDVPKSEEVTKAGLGNANIVSFDDQTQQQQQAAPKQQPGLGAAIKLRRQQQTAQPTTPTPAPTNGTPPPPPIATSTRGVMLSDEVVNKFARAYENVGLFEQKLAATGPNSLRADLTADSEDKVFNAISATSFLMVRNAGVPNARIDMVELFMKTTTGGSSGRFQMNRADAEALDKKQITQQEYFVRKVIF